MNSYVDVLRAVENDLGAAPTAMALRLLRPVVAGPDPVRAVRHPLGFVCIPLVRDGPDGVCVHWWRGGSRSRLTTEPVHAHSWDLLSFVLYGTLRNDVVDVVDDGVAPTHRVFEVHSRHGGRDEIRRTARTVQIGRPCSTHNGPGSRYRLRSGRFHASALLEAEAATLVFGRSLPGAVDLTLAALDDADHTTQRQTCDVAETRRVARAVLDRLTG